MVPMAERFFLGPLYAKSLQDRRRGIMGWCAGIIGIVAVQMSVYPSVRSSAGDWQSLIDTFPDAIKKILRMIDYSTPAGYLSAELMTFVMPLIFIGLGASWGARLTTEDEEGGTADVLLTLPVTRSAYVTTRWMSALSVILIAAATMGGSLAVGARILDMDIPLVRFVQVSLAMLLLGASVMSIAAALGAAAGKRNIALGVAMSIEIALFVLYSLAPLVAFIEDLNPFNPLQWTMGMDALRSGFHFGYGVLTTTLSVILIAMTYLVFDGRDIR